MNMEYIDIFNGNNNLTGIIKEKEQDHKDGEVSCAYIFHIQNSKNSY